MSKNVIGSGVGLSIAKGIIDAHGGSIWVESERGQGSRFYVTIPVSYTHLDVYKRQA